MRNNRRAILADIHERNLDPTIAHTNVDKSGRMVSTETVEEQAINKKDKSNTQKSQPKKQKDAEVEIAEKSVGEIVNDLKPADIIEQQDGFLIPSIAKKIANVSTVDEETFVPEIVENDMSAKKTKKKKKASNQD